MTTTDNVGYLVWLSQVATQIDPAAFIKALGHTDHAALAEHVTEPPGAHASLRRAVRRGTKATPKGYAWREVSADGEDLIVVLVSEEKDTNALNYKAEAVAAVAVNESKGTFFMELGTVDPGQEHVVRAAMDKMQALYELERGVLGANELWIFVRTVCQKLKGNMMRDGVYFVPQTSEVPGQFESVNVALKRVNASAKVVAIPITLGQSAELKSTLEGSLVSELEDLQKTLAERQKAAEEKGRRIHRGGVQRIIEDALELKGKATLMKGLLKLNIAELEKGIKQCEQDCQNALDKSWEREEGAAA